MPCPRHFSTAKPAHSVGAHPLVMTLSTAPSLPDTALVRQYLLGLQRNLADTLGALDDKSFLIDEWQRSPTERLRGDGATRIIEDGAVFERGGIAFSHVHGDTLPASATAHRAELAGSGFEAMGVSLVMHPRNPYCPTAHMNVRLFIAWRDGDIQAFWFGGGMDLTPYYGFDEDAIAFHRHCRDALAPFGASLYPRFKRWCDEYFFLKHRQEPRGIGGIFYDDFSELGFARSFEMMKNVGDAFLAAYVPIVERRRDMPYTQRQRNFQSYRRSRYVEFNLVYDRGTLFGLQSGGRTESILLSMPPCASWRYDWRPEPNSPEAALTQEFLCARDWLAYE